MLSEQHNHAVKDLTDDEVVIESIDFNNLKVTAKCSDLWEVVLTSVKGSTYKLSLNKVWNTLVAENY